MNATKKEAMLWLGWLSKLVSIRNNRNYCSFGTIRNKTFVSVVSVSYRNREFQCFTWTETNRSQPKQFNREHIFVFFAEKLGLFRFVSVCFETVCFGCFTSIPKQRVSMFRLNQNKQKTNRNSLIESMHILVFFRKFRVVSVCFETILFVSVVSI